MISREQAKAIKGACNIVEVAQRYVAMRPVGKQWVGRCPLHGDREVSNRSLTVSPEWQTWRCWSCGKSGDVIALVMAFEDVAFPLAVRFLAEQAGMGKMLRAQHAH